MGLEAVTLTHTPNSYVDQTCFSRMMAFKVAPHLVIFMGNLSTSAGVPASQTSAVKIGSIGIAPAYSQALNLVTQKDVGTLLVEIKSNGDITISNYTGVNLPTDWYRFACPLVV